MNREKIGCIGEAMIELSLNEDISSAGIGFAGDVFNTAIYLNRHLEGDQKVFFVSALGVDRFSDQLIELLEGEAIKTTMIERLETRTPGLYAIINDSKGERSFQYWRSESAARQMFSQECSIAFKKLEDLDIIYLSAITMAILSEETRRKLLDWLIGFRGRGGRVVFDSNYRPVLWESRDIAQKWVDAIWKITDVALPSIEDECELFGDASEHATVERLRHYQFSVGMLKRGHLGPLSVGKDGLLHTSFNRARRVVDTTAAGDSFNGAFLAAYLTTFDIDYAALKGHECASRVIGYKGAILPRALH